MQGSAANRLNTVEQFKALCERFCRLVAREGYEVRPYSGSGPKVFPTLPPESQVRVLSLLEQYLRVCEATVASGWSLKEDAHLLWRMFQEIGVRPDSTLMDAIHQGDVIEVYNTEFVQIFRNMPFFSICSYTLDELLSRPFWELFRRDEALTGQLLGVAQKIISGELKGVHQWTVPVHSLEEVDSQDRNQMTMEEKIISPLYDSSDKVSCFVTTCRILSCIPARRSVITGVISHGKSGTNKSFE